MAGIGITSTTNKMLISALFTILLNSSHSLFHCDIHICTL